MAARRIYGVYQWRYQDERHLIRTYSISRWVDLHRSTHPASLNHPRNQSEWPWLPQKCEIQHLRPGINLDQFQSLRLPLISGRNTFMNERSVYEQHNSKPNHSAEAIKLYSADSTQLGAQVGAISCGGLNTNFGGLPPLNMGIHSGRSPHLTASIAATRATIPMSFETRRPTAGVGSILNRRRCPRVPVIGSDS